MVIVERFACITADYTNRRGVRAIQHGDRDCISKRRGEGPSDRTKLERSVGIQNYLFVRQRPARNSIPDGDTQTVYRACSDASAGRCDQFVLVSVGNEQRESIGRYHSFQVSKQNLGGGRKR